MQLKASPSSVECATDCSEDIGESSSVRPSIPYLKLLLDQGCLTPSVIHHRYPGTGTEADPYLVGWIDNDPRNPVLFSEAQKWVWTLLESLATFAVALTTSAYSAAAVQLIDEFQVDREIFEVGFSVFVLGFALGPLLWAPLSEIYGRQILFFMTVSTQKVSVGLSRNDMLVSPVAGDVYRVQCCERCGANFWRAYRAAVLERFLRLILIDQRWRSRGRHLPGISARACYSCLLFRTFARTCSWTRDRRFPCGKPRLALDGRVLVSMSNDKHEE